MNTFCFSFFRSSDIIVFSLFPRFFCFRLGPSCCVVQVTHVAFTFEVPGGRRQEKAAAITKVMVPHMLISALLLLCIHEGKWISSFEKGWEESLFLSRSPGYDGVWINAISFSIWYCTYDDTSLFGIYLATMRLTFFFIFLWAHRIWFARIHAAIVSIGVLSLKFSRAL